MTAGVVLFGAALFLIGNQHKAFHHHIVFYTNFQNVDGLPKGAKVRVDGMDAGELVKYPDPIEPGAEVPPENECRRTASWPDSRRFAGHRGDRRDSWETNSC